MTNRAVEAIRQAEEQAAVLCRVAGEKAAEMRAQIEREGKAYCETVERETEEAYARELEEIRARARALTHKKECEAEAEAKALRRAALEKKDEAVKLIIWGIVEKCQ